jgi:hypothetical protein
MHTVYPKIPKELNHQWQVIMLFCQTGQYHFIFISQKASMLLHAFMQQEKFDLKRKFEILNDSNVTIIAFKLFLSFL